MPEWLQSSLATNGGAPPAVLAGRLLLALLLGWAIAAIYRLTLRSQPVTATFPPTLILLTLLIATVTQVIGDNVARAFSLVGALSIVRFRTIVQDTRDTAFVIFAVTEGMAVGAGHAWVALLALVVIGGAAILGEPRHREVGKAAPEMELTVRGPLGSRPDAMVETVREDYLAQCDLTEVGTTGRGSAMEAVYAVRLQPGRAPEELVEALNAMEGVQSVSLRQR